MRIRDLPLPPLLLTLMREGRWRDPDPEALAHTMPWFQDPLMFLTNEASLRRENGALDHLIDDEDTARIFGLNRAGAELPLLDIDRAVLIAVCRNAGDDVAVALDHRTSMTDPRVVASDAWTEPPTIRWRVIAPDFSTFVNRIGL